MQCSYYPNNLIRSSFKDQENNAVTARFNKEVVAANPSFQAGQIRGMFNINVCVLRAYILQSPSWKAYGSMRAIGSSAESYKPLSPTASILNLDW